MRCTWLVYTSKKTRKVMIKVNVKEARIQLSRLLDQVEQGEVVLITRKGKKVAQMIPPKGEHRMPSLKDLRASLTVKGKPLSRTVIDAREEERQ